MTYLRRRMTEDMLVRNLSPNTQLSYVQQVSQFARYFGKSPDTLGPEDIRTYQLYLTNEKKLAPSSILIAVAALRFLYMLTLHKKWTLEEIIPAPRKPQKLPIVLSPEGVLRFLGCVHDPTIAWPSQPGDDGPLLCGLQPARCAPLRAHWICCLILWLLSQLPLLPSASKRSANGSPKD